MTSGESDCLVAIYSSVSFGKVKIDKTNIKERRFNQSYFADEQVKHRSVRQVHTLRKSKEVKAELSKPSSLTHFLLTDLHGCCFRLCSPTTAGVTLSACKFNTKATRPNAPRFPKHYRMLLDVYSGFLSVVVF